MKKILFLAFLISLAAQAQVKPKETALNIAIGIDEIQKLDYKFNTKVGVGNESLLQLILAPNKREITFRGVKAGKTSVTVRDGVGDIRDKFIVTVTSDGVSNIVRELRELIGEIEGISIGIKGGKVVVEGEIVVPDQIGKVTTVLQRYPDVLVLVEYSKQTQLIVAREMQEAINQNGMKDVTVRVVNGNYWLEGVVNSEGKKTLAVNIAKEYLPDTLSGLGQSSGGSRFTGKVRGEIADFINVNVKKDPKPPPKLVKVSAQFVELSKDYIKIFAFKWAPFLSNDSSISFGNVDSDGNTTSGINTSENGSLSGTIARLFPRLQAGKKAGYARVLQSGMAVTNEGQQVTIKKDSVLNFAVGTGEGQEARTANISFEMSTTPQIQVQENVNLTNLNIAVSLPNGQEADGAPQTTRNEVKTNLVVKSKESAVIGGIMQANSATAYDKNDPDPQTASGEGNEGSAQSAPLFNLLRSKQYTTEKSQFVVFVTPEILESASKGTEEIRRKFRKRER